MKKYNFLFWTAALLIGMALSCEEESFLIPQIKITAEVTPASGYGAKDGAVTVEVEGGQPPYSYFWSNGATEPDMSGLSAGSYTLKVIDSGSAVASRTIVVDQPPATPLSLDFAVDPVTWYGGDNGKVVLTVAGGAPPYAFLWSNGEDTREIEGLVAGNYSVTVTDSGDPAVVTTGVVSVTQPDFVCGRDSITDVDGNKYPTVSIGDLCWTAENLRTLHDPQQPDEKIEGAYCNGLNCTNALGAHYTWTAAVQGAESASGEEETQGVCPCEWHLPTREEWENLNRYLSVNGQGGDGVNVPNKMRGAESSSGFDALNAGNWGYSVFTGETAVFWTATEQSEGRAFYRILNNFPLLGQGHVSKDNGLSVRCVKNR